jgi:hypothetical protein
MRKISYRNKDFKPQVLPPTDELPTIGKSDSSTESGGRSGFHFPGEPQTHDLPDEEISDPVSLIKDLVETADGADLDGMEVEADFFDFLITKFAQVIKEEPSQEERYIDFIYKIYNSNIPNSFKKIGEMSTRYSAKINSGINSGVDKESAKKASFNSELLMVK